MNETVKTIKSRRSCKKFLDNPVPQELIDEILECGMSAPSGKGLQSAIILAVTNKEVRELLRHENALALGKEDIDPFYGAPVILVVLAKKDIFTHVYDGSIVAENMLLAAHSLGLGACWIHRAKEEFESEVGKKILKDAGITDEYEGIANIIVGYRDGEVLPFKPRKENYVYYIK